ncbi:hypothetical protein [Pseudoduganella violacea]|uniref:Uncharacterized protein n=1 Tax=Pseudoduganella violacea TaxID=1715466 RepID=A0A7W5B7Z1_9BURK|nr:hypothetical protein [Pseudoduganella violacea]MBB3118113.1 hypothetical protein [Pseudoduganella violacea]
MSEQEQESVQDLVMVINRAGHIENLFNQIISDYVGPREHAWYFMWSVVLDTSVMPLGAKLKVVAAIAHELNYKFPWKESNDVIQYRNSFAHNTSDAHPVLSIGTTDEETTSYNLLYTLNAQGVLRKVKRHEAFTLFNESYKTSKAALVELKDLVQKQIAEHNAFAAASKAQEGDVRLSQVARKARSGGLLETRRNRQYD